MSPAPLVRPATKVPPPPPFERQGLHVMSKPIGPICNLDCEYCYYLHKEELYPSTTSWRMPEHTLGTYIRQYIDAQPPGAQEITFAWQGGEPTLLGLDFFRRAADLQQQHAPPGVRIVNSLQTNGTLLDTEWAEFFRQNKFLIGLSIDGPEELHDRYRYDKKGRGSFRDVLRGLNLLKRHGVEFNALVVVNRHNGDHGRRVYTYLRDNGVRFLQFIPIVEQRGVGVHGEPLVQLELGQMAAIQATSQRGREGEGERGKLSVGSLSPSPPLALPSSHSTTPPSASPEHLVSTRSVLPDQFGRFLIDVFDEWVKRDVGKVYVQIFDQALSAWLGLEPSLCVFRRQCGRALAIEHNGDLYSCDHFVEPEWFLGNIHDTSIAELAGSNRQRAFGEAKESTLPRYCRECEVRFVCNGECPKNRILATPDGEPGLNYLCAGYRAFFNHIDQAMKFMAAELRAGRPAANVMAKQAPRTSQRAASVSDRSSPHKIVSSRQSPPNRNDFCPCGSGKKFKKCCGARA